MAPKTKKKTDATAPLTRTLEVESGGQTTRVRQYLEGVSLIEIDGSGRRMAWFVDDYGTDLMAAVATGSWGKVVDGAEGFADSFPPLPAAYLDNKVPPADVRSAPETGVFALDVSRAPVARTVLEQGRDVWPLTSDGKRAVFLRSVGTDSRHDVATVITPGETFSFAFTMNLRGGRPEARPSSVDKAVFAGELLVAAVVHELVGIDMRGVVRWSNRIGEISFMPPVATKGVVAAWPSSKKVVGIHVGTGKKLWTADTRSEGYALAADENAFYTLDKDDKLQALDPLSGKTIWAKNVSAFGHILVSGGHLFTRGHGGVTCHDAATGATLWTSEASIHEAIIGEDLLTFEKGGGFAVRRRATAEVVRSLSTMQYGCQIVCGDTILQTEKKAATLSAYALQDGALRWRLTTAELFPETDGFAETSLLPVGSSILVIGEKTVVRLDFR